MFGHDSCLEFNYIRETKYNPTVTNVACIVHP